VFFQVFVNLAEFRDKIGKALFEARFEFFGINFPGSYGLNSTNACLP